MAKILRMSFFAMFFCFLFKEAVSTDPPRSPPVNKQKMMDRMDGIDGIVRNGGNSGRTSPTLSGGSTPEMFSTRSQMRKSASIATDRMPSMAAAAMLSSGGSGRSSSGRKIPLSPQQQRPYFPYSNGLSSPNMLSAYQPQQVINMNLCFPNRYNLFRNRSTDERKKKFGGLKNSLRMSGGIYPPNLSVSPPAGVNATTTASSSGENKAKAQLSRESSEKKQQQKNKGKEKDESPKILKDLNSKRSKSKKSSEEEGEKEKSPKKSLNRMLRKLFSRGGNLPPTGMKQEVDKCLDFQSPQRFASPAGSFERRQQPFSDTSNSQGFHFPSPDLNRIDSSPQSQWWGENSSNNASKKSKEFEDSSSSSSKRGSS